MCTRSIGTHPTFVKFRPHQRERWSQPGPASVQQLVPDPGSERSQTPLLLASL
jgi:hypothetical protein